MKIYKLKHDSQHFQYFLPKEGERDPFASMDCTSLKEVWSPPAVSIPRPDLARGNFFNFGDGFLIADARAIEAMRVILGASGEFLPLPYDGQLYTVFNATACFDALDHELTTWRPATEGRPPSIERYVFKRIPMHPTFKIPEEDSTSLFYTIGNLDPSAYDLRRLFVQPDGLKGLILEEVWTDGEEDDDEEWNVPGTKNPYHDW